jgi:hypothetical protein
MPSGTDRTLAEAVVRVDPEQSAPRVANELIRVRFPRRWSAEHRLDPVKRVNRPFARYRAREPGLGQLMDLLLAWTGSSERCASVAVVLVFAILGTEAELSAAKASGAS